MLKQPGTYEYELADLVLPAIAHCTKKDVLIFNTSSQAHSPVYVIAASMLCNGSANTEIPVCLAYNQVHYETLIPDTDTDIRKTISLKNEVIAQTYSLKMEDISFLSKNTIKKTYAQILKSAIKTSESVSKEENTNRDCRLKSNIDEDNEKVKLDLLKQLGAKKRTKEQEKEYKYLMEKNRRKSKRINMTETENKMSNIETKKESTFKHARLKSNIDEENEKVKLEMLKQLGAKKRTKEQDKEYRRLMQKNRRKSKLINMTESNIQNSKQKEADRKRNERRNQTMKEKELANEKNKNKMKEIRANKSEKEKDMDNEIKRKDMKKRRGNRSEKEKEDERNHMKIQMQAKRAVVTSEEKLESNISKLYSNPLFCKGITDKINEDEMKYLNIGNIFEQPTCEYCNAYLWPLQSQIICCNNGKMLDSVKAYEQPPASLCKLLQDKKFCQDIKEYNNAMAFASLGIDKTPEVGPNFKILGKLHHKIGSIGCPSEGKPKFAQLYF